MDSPVSPTHGEQEGTAWNGHFDCSGCHPLFVCDQSGMPERRALRHGNVHGADGRREVGSGDPCRGRLRRHRRLGRGC